MPLKKIVAFLLSQKVIAHKIHRSILLINVLFILNQIPI